MNPMLRDYKPGVQAHGHSGDKNSLSAPQAAGTHRVTWTWIIQFTVACAPTCKMQILLTILTLSSSPPNSHKLCGFFQGLVFQSNHKWPSQILHSSPPQSHLQEAHLHPRFLLQGHPGEPRYLCWGPFLTVPNAIGSGPKINGKQFIPPCTKTEKVSAQKWG